MQVGIGLPTTIAGVEGHTVIDWARRAEAAQFSTLGTIDRLVYGNYEPFTALAAAAAVTERIRLTTAVLLAPLRSNSAMLAKEAASLDRLSNGRLVLGLGIGGREDDFEASGIDFRRRGRQFDAQLEDMRRIWSGESRGFAGAIGPRSVQEGGPQILIGGTAEASMRRVATYGAGWIAGGGGPGLFAQAADMARAAWQAAERPGTPRLAALAYYALGTDARQHANAYLRDYYGFATGYVDMVADSAITTEEAVRQAQAAYSAAGCDELILFPCNPDPGQIELLAQALTVG